MNSFSIIQFNLSMVISYRARKADNEGDSKSSALQLRSGDGRDLKK